MAAWGYKYLPVAEELAMRAKLLSDGGPTMWAEMDELREIHLGLKPKRRAGPSVGERLQAAYGKVMAKKAKGSRQRGATRECLTNVAETSSLTHVQKRQLSPSQGSY